MVEQGTHKPLVGGSNPPSATNSTRATALRSGGPFRFLHLRSRHHPARVRRPSRWSWTGPPSRGRHRTRRYTRPHGDARSSPARPRRPPVEPQVLPERHRHAGARRRHRAASAVHVDQSTPATTPTVGYSQFLSDVAGRQVDVGRTSRATRSRSSSRAARPPTPSPSRAS